MFFFLLKKPIELYHSTKYFAVFVICLQIFYERTGHNGSCVCYKVYVADKLTNNCNLYKDSIRPK